MLLVGAFGHVRVGKRGDCECGMAWDGLFRLFFFKEIADLLWRGYVGKSESKMEKMSRVQQSTCWCQRSWPVQADRNATVTSNDHQIQPSAAWKQMHASISPIRKQVTAQRLKKSSPQVRLCPHVIKLVSHDWVHCTRGLHRVTPSYSYGANSQECIQYLCTTKSRSSTEGGLNPVRVRCDHESIFIR